MKPKASLHPLTTLVSLFFAALFSVQTAQAQTDAEEGPEVVSFYMNMGPEGDVLSSTTGTDLNMGSRPDGVALLSSQRLRKGLALTARLRNRAGEVIGLVAELENFPDGPGPGSTWDAHWMVLVPGVGSLYGYETESVPPEHLEAFAAVAKGKTWSGKAKGKVANGPGPKGWGRVIGGTGAWEGAKGSFAEIVELKEFGPSGMTGELELRFLLER